MKKIVIVMMLMVGVTALAQRGERGNQEGMKDLSPEQRATLQTKKATLALDLTEAQQSQMKAFFMEKAEMRKAKMEERKALKESGDAKTEEPYARAEARLDYQIAQKAKLAEILSDEQMEKWVKMQDRKGKHRREKGRKGKGDKNKSEK